MLEADRKKREKERESAMKDDFYYKAMTNKKQA
jgi:hypothetical protein